MDDSQQDQYEQQLKDLFQSFDASGSGSLGPDELSDLCHALQLEEATPALLHALLQSQDHPADRVDFNQFKDALILVLSSSIAAPPPNQEPCSAPDSPEVHPKFVRGNKRYGRRSTPGLADPMTEFSEVGSTEPTEPTDEDRENHDDSTVPRKRERWNTHDSNTEEYEAEGQLHLWNPDEPGTPRISDVPLSDHLEERLWEACRELAVSWDGPASHHELLALCEHSGLEVTEDVLQKLTGDDVMSVQDFASRVLGHSKPSTPSASTPYRQLKRHHSTQPFDETGRRVAASSAMTSTIGMRLFSSLDDGTGYTPVQHILEAWMAEGIENSAEILQALDFSLDGKLNLGELTSALENELLMTKNRIHQAALASFKAEIRHLLECVDRELREKEKIRSDLEKSEKLKTQLAAEVDEHHSAIERTNDSNLRKLEQDHKERLAAVRTELLREMDQIQQQAGLQREELENEMRKIREDETFLRDHLSITVKENRRIEMELLDSTEKLVEAEILASKLQKNLDKILKEKFGDLDPDSAEFLLQEERLQRLRSSYEKQCRELQDRIDELQAELQEFHSGGRAPQLGTKLSLLEEFESKSPGMESDPGIGSEEGQPFNMSLEAEMMLEQLKEHHLHEIETLRSELECKVSELDQKVKEQRVANEAQKAAVFLQYQEEIQRLKEEMSAFQIHAQDLQSQLELAELERTRLASRQAGEREDLEKQQEEEVATLRQELLQAHTHAADLEGQLETLEAQQAEAELGLDMEKDELQSLHALELNKLKEEHGVLFKARLEENRNRLLEDRAEGERKLLDEWGRERVELQQRHEDAIKAKVEELSVRFQAVREEHEMRLTEQWEKEKAQLDRQSIESLQVALEGEMLRLITEQEAREGELVAQWEFERARLQEHQEVALITRLSEEREKLQQQHEQREEKLKEEWERERLQLVEDYEGMVQERLDEEREKLEAEKEELEKRLGKLTEEKMRSEESHREAMRELSAKHSEERERLSGLLDKLRQEVAEERKELEEHFSQRIKEVETRFSGDQEAISVRFQTDVLNLEQHYQNELKYLSESHAEQKMKWEAEVVKTLQDADAQRRILQETMEQERESLHQKATKEKVLLQSTLKEKVDESNAKKQELQKQLESFESLAQVKEIELNQQLNDLHNRLQENLNTKDELLAQSEKKAFEIELLLNQVVEDFKQEKLELESRLTELGARYAEALSLSERQHEERTELLSDRDELKSKIEDLERLLPQTAEDFELEKQDISENLPSCKLQENEKAGLIAERYRLNLRIQELKVELDQLLESKDGTKEKETEDSNEEELKTGTLDTFCPEEQEPCTEHIEFRDEAGDNETAVIPEDCNVLGVEPVAPVEQGQDVVEISTEYPHDLEGCDQYPTVTSNYLSVPGEKSAFVDEQAQVDVELIRESSDVRAECPRNTSASDEVLAPTGDQVPVEERNAIEDHAQDDVSKGGVVTESLQDTEIFPENVIVSAEASHDEDFPEDGQVSVEESKYLEDQEPADDNKDSHRQEVTLTDDDITKSSVPEDKSEHSGVDEDKDKCSSEMPYDGEVGHFPPEGGAEHNDAGEDEANCDRNGTYKSGVVEVEPQDVQFDDKKSLSTCEEEQPCHEPVVETSGPEETEDPEDGTKDERLPDGSHGLRQDAELVPKQQQECAEAVKEQDVCVRDDVDLQVQAGQSEEQVSLAELQGQYVIATEENLLLQHRIAQLQRKTDTMCVLFAGCEERAAGQLALEENSSLNAKRLTLMEQVEEMARKASELTDLQIRYEECICENVKLGEQNYKLVKRIWELESKMHIIQDFHDLQVALLDKIVRMRENFKLTARVSDLERQDARQEAESSEGIPRDSLLELNYHLEAKNQALSELEDCCTGFEKQNGKLRRALTDLRDKSLSMHRRMQAHRSEASRLAEENLLLQQKIATMKEEDLWETHEEMLLQLEHFRKEKNAAQKTSEGFKRQISELRLRSKQLENENGFLAQKNAENAAGVDELGQQLKELLRQKERRKETVRDQQALPTEERTKMVACVSALEAELTKALEVNVLLEEGKAQHMQQLSVLREKVAEMGAKESQLTHMLQERQSAEKQSQGLHTQLSQAQERIQTQEEALQTVSVQSTRLKSDLRVSQQEKEALKQEVISLHKQLQNVNDKNQVLEIALHSSGFQSAHKKMYRSEMSQLVEQEQELLRQENERLQMEVHNAKGDLLHSREKIRQLESSVLSLKQQKQQSQSSLARALEQDKSALKKDLEALQKELLTAKSSQGREDGEGQRELENLRQENEALKTQTARLHAQLIEALQSQLGRLLPASSHRSPGERRGQQRADDHIPENMPDDRERMMRSMEERMREIELSLHNVKLLLKEKVFQLKEQVHRNGKADMLIKDLYVENAKLLKALEMTEQHKKITEKKNYLLEEKISSLNKKVRDLTPAPRTPVPYPYTCS